MLGLAPTALGATQVASLLDLRLEDLLSGQRRRGGVPMLARLRNGAALYVQLQMASAVPISVAPAVVKLSLPAADALARLDTGDARWRSAADKARRVVDKPIPLLIQGESGVGKELFARALHESGPRRSAPFVSINCAAVPEHLIEAELFGYAPGAFTGARREGSVGRLREAHGGTLFLDEIGDMPLSMQTRLLRVLQERQVTPLGGARAVDVDFALICATHRKLREEAASGSFRSDLYYRINGLTVQLPALRERTDFAVLTQRLLAGFNPGREVLVDSALLRQFSQHNWPGNLRQYANVLRTASAMLEPHEACISLAHLPDDLLEDLMPVASQHVAPPTVTPAAAVQGHAVLPGGNSQSLEALSRVAIRAALDCSGGNMSQAARRLGISRQTLYRKLGG
jgi:transcriptional regulator with PAS, ATPase and Fis domain